MKKCRPLTRKLLKDNGCHPGLLTDMSVMKKKKDDIAHAKEVARLAEIARIEAARMRKEQKIICTRFRDELLPPNNVHRWHPLCCDNALDIFFVQIDFPTSQALDAIMIELAIYQQNPQFEKMQMYNQNKMEPNRTEISVFDRINY